MQGFFFLSGLFQSNEFLSVLMVLVNFGAVLLIYRFAGRTGLYVWIPISTIVANIQVIKMVSLFGMESTLGNVVYSTSFLVTDILSENYGKKASNKAVALGFFSLFFFAVIMKLTLMFKPSAADFSQASLEAIFGFMPRIALASFVAYGLSQFHDVWAYHFWKRLVPDFKHIWVRNNLSTMVSQAIDTAAFTLIAFYGVMEAPVLFQLFWTAYVLKLLIALCDTPFVYLAAWIKKHNKVREYELAPAV